MTPSSEAQHLLPTVGQVLEGPALRAADPLVVAGTSSLDRRVRWVHVGEVPDIASMLEGGELVLTTGIGMPRGPEGLTRYVIDLAAAGAVGLVVELGGAVAALPRALIAAAESSCLPLVALRKVARFVAITEEVHAQILSEQLQALRASEVAHQVFTSLCVQGASATDIVREVADMTGVPVVFENLVHRVLAHDSRSRSADEVLQDWHSQSRAADDVHPSGAGVLGDWLTTKVEVRGEALGRLAALTGTAPSTVQVMTLERGAVALTLNRLLEHNRESLERQAHRSLLTDLIERRYGSAADMIARAASLGVPLSGRDLVSIVVDVPLSATPFSSPGRLHHDKPTEGLAAAVRQQRMSALIGRLRDDRIALLLSLPIRADRDTALRSLCEVIHERFVAEGQPPVIAAATTVQDLDKVAGAIAEAEHVATAARGYKETKPFYELPDIELRGLLYVLGDDPRVQSFVERSLGPLLSYDARHRANLLPSLRAFLTHAGNKSLAADSLAISRQAFYRRLSLIARILEADLDSGETRTSLHAATIALEFLRPS